MFTFVVKIIFLFVFFCANRMWIKSKSLQEVVDYPPFECVVEITFCRNFDLHISLAMSILRKKNSIHGKSFCCP
jgi:hypothetical protein